jgi:hypothetical protein
MFSLVSVKTWNSNANWPNSLAGYTRNQYHTHRPGDNQNFISSTTVSMPRDKDISMLHIMKAFMRMKKTTRKGDIWWPHTFEHPEMDSKQRSKLICLSHVIIVKLRFSSLRHRWHWPILVILFTPCDHIFDCHTLSITWTCVWY